MQLNYLAPFQAIARTKSQFALFFVAFFVAKLLHLGSHAGSLPIVLYLLYTPTFFLPDVLLLVGSKVLVYRLNGGQSSAIRKCFGGLLALVTTACSAAQISFFVETGGEIQWMAASRVLGGTGGMGLLLSGLPSMIVASMFLYAISLVISPKFYDAVNYVLERISWSFRHCYLVIVKRQKVTEEHELLISILPDEHSASSENDEGPEEKQRPNKQLPSTTTAFVIAITTLAATITVTTLQSVRPITPPYAHMSGSLPITIIEAAWFQPINSEFCLPHPVEVVPFPFDRFPKFFNMPQSLDWAPKAMVCGKANGPRPPPWVQSPEQHDRNDLMHDDPAGDVTWPPGHHPGPRDGEHPPGPAPHGPPPHGSSPHEPPPPTHNIDDHSAHEHPPSENDTGNFGGSTCDPLKLSNLDADILTPLAAQIKAKKPKIKHVLLLTMESTRKDMFPFTKGSHAYDIVRSSYSSLNATGELDIKLRGFTDAAAFLTGQPSGFEPVDRGASEKSWKSSFKEGMGAININGAVSQAAYTLKSLLSSHCGVEPLAVDFAEETKGVIYQHCLSHVFKKMGSSVRKEASDEKQSRADKGEEKDHRLFPWASTMIQSVTDQYDSQDVLDRQMGFENVIAESTISDPTSDHYPPKMGFINYFGYAETETFDYLRDLFVNAEKTEERLFVSHLTSTPHHPFKTPKNWDGQTTYANRQHWRRADPFDDYMNTIQFQDQWISQIFQMLHDVGVLEETLVVMTGDHGLAFSSLDNSQSAVNNGHVSNFRIPILFVHPDLPRIQLNASITPTSILPTVLDLLLQTDSLAEPAAKVARDILPSYQGHSLIRDLDYRVNTADDAGAKAFFQPFHFSAINPGGSLLAISDASTSFRLVLPLCSAIPLRFTDVSGDPYEWDPTTAWTMGELRAQIKVKYGARASEWAQLAGDLGRWWVWDQRERWGYWGEARETSRGGAEVGGDRGRIRKHHWWETKR